MLYCSALCLLISVWVCVVIPSIWTPVDTFRMSSAHQPGLHWRMVDRVLCFFSFFSAREIRRDSEMICHMIWLLFRYFVVFFQKLRSGSFFTAGWFSIFQGLQTQRKTKTCGKRFVCCIFTPAPQANFFAVSYTVRSIYTTIPLVQVFFLYHVTFTK